MTRSLPGAGAARKALSSATLMYLTALGMSGVAILLSVALPPDQRGLLVATTTSASVGVAIGGFSLETFLLAQGRRWLEEQASLRSLVLYLVTIPVSAGLGWVLAQYSAEASPSISAAGAACIAASNIPSAAGLTLGRFLTVYRYRAIYASIAPALYLVLILASVRNAEVWLLAWLGCQALMAVSFWVKHGGALRPAARRSAPTPERLSRMGLTHTGAVAQVFTYRFDQLALARYQGADELAVYSLAVAAIEFSQSGAVVAAQRTLGDHDEGSADRMRGVLRKTLYLAVGTGVLVLVGLAAIGTLATGYEAALLLGALLVPRSIAVAVGKVLSARLVNLGGERTTALVAIGTALAAVVGYSLVAPSHGAAGVALVSVVLFTLHSITTALAVRARGGRADAPDSTTSNRSEVSNLA